MFVVPEWIERHCVVPDGFRKGAPFRLYPYQLRYIGAMYLVRHNAIWVPENPVLGPAFVYRRGLLAGPQKYGKNPMISTQVCVEGMGPALFAGFAGVDEGYVCREHGCPCGWEYPYEPGEPKGMQWPTPLIQITAFSEDSTENTYDALRPMIEEGPLADVVPRTGEEFIRLPGGGKIDTVTSSNQSRLGQRVTFVPQDELGLWTAANKMVKLADTQYRNLAGMGGRSSLTTNAWDPAEHSVAQREYESSAADIYRQFVQPPKSLSYGDKRDRRRIHRIVYEPEVLRENGGHLDLDSVEAEAAGLAEHDMPQAARFYGNMLMTGAGYAVDGDLWDQLERIRQVDAGEYIGAGFDGSISDDATFLRGCTADGFGFLLGAWVAPVADELVRWELAHPGERWRVPRLEVLERIAWMRRTYRVGRFFYDPPKWWTEGEQWVRDFGNNRDGDPIAMPFDTNVPRRMAPACDRWQTAIRLGTHTHDGDRLTTAHVKAAHQRQARGVTAEDGRTLHVIVKGDDRRKIDGAVADVLAHEAAMTMPPAPARRGGGSRWIGGYGKARRVA